MQFLAAPKIPVVGSLPAGGNVGELVYYNGSFYRWTGAAWTQFVNSVAGKTGAVTLDKSDVGLANVDNTSDLAKPISTATQTALDLKLNSSTYTAADVLAKLLTVDGAASGLDADLLDGQQGTQYMRIDRAETITGTKTFNGGSLYFFAAGSNVYYEGDGTTRVISSFKQSGTPTFYLKLMANGSLNFESAAAGTFQINGNLAWHAGNDGSGSGLDADTVDGVQAAELSRYVMRTATGTSGDSGYWSNVATVTIPGGSTFQDLALTLRFLLTNTGSRAYATVNCKFRKDGSDVINTAIDIQEVVGNGYLTANSFKITTDTGANTAKIWVRKNATFGKLTVFEVFRSFNTGTTASIAYHDSSAWQATDPVGTESTVQTSDLKFNQNIIWHEGNDGAGSNLDAGKVAGTTPTTAGLNLLSATNTVVGDANKVVKVNASGNGFEYGAVLGSAATQDSSYFALASHTHSIANITGLQTALDDKLDDADAGVFGLSFLGSDTSATATALLDAFTVTEKGLVPAPSSSTGRYLKDDGTWDSPPSATPLTSWEITAASTGSSQVITLPETVAEEDVVVTVGGLAQKSTDYAITGTSLTITAPDSGLDIMVRRLGGIVVDATVKHTMTLALSDLATDLTVGTLKAYWDPPYPITITAVSASALTAPTGSSVIVDVNEEGTSILSTKISIDDGDIRSSTSSTPPVISDANVSGRMTFDIDQVGSTVAGTGLQVTIEYTET